MTGRCGVCLGVSFIQVPLTEGVKCRDCGLEWYPKHPDPLGLAMTILRRNTREVNGRVKIGAKITAIRWYRKMAEVGLREAKEVVDALAMALEKDLRRFETLE